MIQISPHQETSFHQDQSHFSTGSTQTLMHLTAYDPIKEGISFSGESSADYAQFVVQWRNCRGGADSEEEVGHG